MTTRGKHINSHDTFQDWKWNMAARDQWHESTIPSKMEGTLMDDDDAVLKLLAGHLFLG